MSRKRAAPAGEIFLSHSSRDQRIAERLARVLRHHGLPVWYSPTNIVGAQQWHDEIGRALARCDWFVILLSPAALKSKWVKRELQYALREDRFDGRIVPLLCKRCDFSAGLSWTLPGFQMIDFTQPFGEACHELLRVWGLGYLGEP